MSSLQEPFEEFLSGRDFPFNINHSWPLESGLYSDFRYPVFGHDNFDYSFNFDCGVSSFPALGTPQQQGFGAFGQQPPSEPQPTSGNMVFSQVPNSTDPHSLQLYSQTSTQATSSQVNEFHSDPSDNFLDALQLNQVYFSLFGSYNAATPELATPGESSASEPSSPGSYYSTSSMQPQTRLSNSSETEVSSDTVKATNALPVTRVATAPAAPSDVESSSKAVVPSQAPVPTSPDFIVLSSGNYNTRSGKRKRKETSTPSSSNSRGARKRTKTEATHSVEEDEPTSDASQPKPKPKHGHIKCPWPGCRSKDTYYDNSTMKRHYDSDHENIKFACPGKCGFGPYCRSDVLTRHISGTPPGSRCRTEALRLGVGGRKKRGRRSGGSRKKVVTRTA